MSRLLGDVAVIVDKRGKVSPRKTVIRNKKAVERCWIDKRFKCKCDFVTDRSECVGNCEVYSAWASRLKKTIQRLNDSSRIEHPYFASRLSEAILNYEIDDEVETRWEERARRGVYDVYPKRKKR